MFQIYDYLQKEKGIFLTEQQRVAVETIDGPILLLAVPGAGKTTVIVTRIAHMMHNHNIPPERVLTITFSKAGSIDMRERYEMLFDQLNGIIPDFATIHSFCYRVVRSYCNQTNGKMPELISPKQRTAVVRELYQKTNQLFLSEDLEEELISGISYIKNAMLKEEEAGKIETEIRNLWKLYTAYDDYKKNNGLMDFDDMLGYALTVFRRYPEILAHYRNQYSYLCVDEAQDTSRLQHAVIRLLAAPLNNVFLVGDEDQSIYHFRGACPEHLLDFGAQYPTAKILKIEENFRSVGSIVEATNQFIKQNKKRYSKEMFTKKETGMKVETPRLKNLGDQYRLAIQVYLEEPGTTAVIYRNHLSAIPLADILDRNDINFMIKDHKTSFLKNYVVGDILAFFALSFDKENLEAFSRIFYKTKCFLRRNLILLMSTEKLTGRETFFDRLSELEGEKGNPGKIRYVQTLIEKLKTQHPKKAIETILHQIGYLDYLEYSSASGFSIQVQKIAVLQNLATRAQTVDQFLERLNEMDEVVSQHSKEKNARFLLTTAHSAKGLEYDSVVLLDAVEDIFPTHSAVNKFKTGMEEEMEEEARLFYVACTRARRRLVVPCASASEGNLIQPSRFIFRLEGPPLRLGAICLGAKGKEDEIYPGMPVLHQTFGKGQVLMIDQRKHVFQVFFEKNGTRTLTLDILSTAIIKRLDE